MRVRRKPKKVLSARTLERLSKSDFDGFGKEWNYYERTDQINILRHLLQRCGSVGDQFLEKIDQGSAIENITTFFRTLSQKHSAVNIIAVETVKASLSGPNIDSRKLRNLVAPTSRLETWQKVRDRREHN